MPETEIKPVRTGKELKFNMTQKRYDEENTIAQEEPEEKKFKVVTKGIFGGPTLQLKTSAQQFINDKKWLGLANPMAQDAEKRYLERDRYYLDKRRYQRVLKEIQCELAAGIKGVTKMPANLAKSMESPKK